MKKKILKKRGFLKIFLLVNITFLFTSCEMEPLDIGDVSNVALKKVEGKTVYVSISFPVTNPNGFTINLTKSEIEVFGSGQKLGKVTIDKKLKLKRKETVEQEIMVVLDLSDIMGSGLAMIRFISSGRLELKIKGYVTARAYLLSTKVDIDEKFEINMKDISKAQTK
jgi:LEA14-like dessication related protein